MPSENDDEPVVLSKTQLRELMEEAVENALLRIGVRADDPESVIEMQRDMLWLRDIRVAALAVRRKGALTMAAILVSGLLAATWVGITHLSTVVPPAP